MKVSVTQSRLTHDPMVVAFQAPLFMEFFRQEHWRGLPFPSLGDLPNPGIELVSPALAGRFFFSEPPGKPVELRPLAKSYPSNKLGS